MHATTHLETDNVKAKKCWIGQSAAKHRKSIDIDTMKVQRLSRKGVGPSGPKCGAGMKRDVEARFYEKVKKGEGCHEWMGWIMPNGYGQFHKDGKTQYAHRVAYELANGSAEGIYILHECDNRRCVNPAHLFAGDHDSNMDDMVQKDRHARGERNGHAKLTVEQVKGIRSMIGTQDEIAEKYGVTRSLISMIRSGRIWKHV